MTELSGLPGSEGYGDCDDAESEGFLFVATKRNPSGDTAERGRSSTSPRGHVYGMLGIMYPTRAAAAIFPMVPESTVARQGMWH